jgi:hypothetical protein
MQSTTPPLDEKQRLEALKSYSILDTLPEKQYDDITKLASQICDTSISQITLVDENRQWYKSNYGVDVKEVEREKGFCTHTVQNKGDILMIPDLRKDDRFMNNPFVIGEPHATFYAGVPLTNPDGYNIGAICVIDTVPKILSDSQVESLISLSNIVMHLLELHKTEHTLGAYSRELQVRNDELKQFASIAAHDIKSPLNNIITATNLIEENYGESFDEQGMQLIQLVNKSSNQLSNMISGILEISKNSHVMLSQRELIAMDDFIVEVFDMVNKPQNVNYHFPSGKVVSANKVGLQQIFINLITNAIKHSDKEKIELEFEFENTSSLYRFSIKDNGHGIKSGDINRIFKLFEVGTNGYNGHGIGLTTVKRLVEGSQVPFLSNQVLEMVPNSHLL